MNLSVLIEHMLVRNNCRHMLSGNPPDVARNPPESVDLFGNR
jgi:hypothetical protein